MSLDVLKYEREVYTFFDMLSDVGGLMGIMTITFNFLVSLWTFKYFENYMISKLFKIKKLDADIKPGMEQFAQSDFLKNSINPNCK